MFQNIDDKTLLSEVIGLVKTERQTTLKVLEYLSEIDSRRLWLSEGYSSLFDFCVRCLGYSEGEAGRRIQAARCAAKIEEVKPLLKDNSLSLSGLSQIAPFVTPQNAGELLPQVQGKTTRQIETILHAHFPESRPSEKILKLVLDDELEKLLEEAGQEFSEKEPAALLKKILKRSLARQSRKTWPKKHTRYIPRAIKATLRKEQKQCAYVSPSGVTCNQTAHLQIDHVRPWAKGGSSWDPNNLRVLCRAHNLWMGKRDFPFVSRGR